MFEQLLKNNKQPCNLLPKNTFFFTCRNFELGVGACRIDCPKPRTSVYQRNPWDQLCTSVHNSCQSFCSCLTQTALVWVAEVVPCRARKWQVGSILQELTLVSYVHIEDVRLRSGKKQKFTHKKSARLQVECSHILNVMFFQTSPSLQSPPATAGTKTGLMPEIRNC